MKKRTTGASAKSPFELVASQLFAEPDEYEAMLEWFLQAVLRFGRVFAPDLTREDFLKNPERFYGFLAALCTSLLERTKAVADMSATNPLEELIHGSIAEFAGSSPQILQSVIASAASLRPEKQGEFFAAYSDGINSRYCRESNGTHEG